MKFPIRSLARLQSIVLIGLVCAATSGAELSQADGNAPHKVEFAEVKGYACLQPVVISVDADIEDFRAAEQRWLQNRFPGRPVLHWESLLVLPPDTDGNDEDELATVKTATAYVEAPDGSEIAVCFDIGVRMPKKAEREQRLSG